MSLPPGTTCTVVEDYLPSSFDELELHPGDTITVEELDENDYEKIPDGYLKGTNRHLGPFNGRVGYFPVYVVQVDGESNSERPSTGSSLASNVSLHQKYSADPSVPASATQSYGQLPQDSSVDPDEYVKQLEAKVQVGSRLRVLFPYEAVKSDELDLRTTDTVVVTHCPPGGWWRGAYLTDSGLGKVGWFPCNFVDIIPETEVPVSPSTPKPKSAKKGKKDDISDTESVGSGGKSITRFWKKSTSRSKAPSITDLDKQRMSPLSPPQSRHANASENFLDEPLQLDDDPLMNSISSDNGLAKEKTSSQKSFSGEKAKNSSQPSVHEGARRASSQQSFTGGSVFSNLGRKVSGSFVFGTEHRNSLKDPGSSMLELINSVEAPKRPTKKSWKDGIEQGILDAMSPSEMKKQQVLWELYFTEAAYVKDLKMILDVFMRPLAEKKLLSAKQMETIFSNLESILATNYDLFKTLNRLYELSPIMESFGKEFFPFCEKFIVYSTYCSNNAKALAKVKDLSTSNKALKQFLTEAYQSEITRHLDLASFLIKPMQRICKYPLLLREIVKNTPVTHPDRRNLEVALAKLQNVIMVVNEGVDGLQKITEIQNSFAEKLNIISPTRYFVKEDQVSVLTPPPESRSKPRAIYLFNDMLILAKKDWRDKNHVVENVAVENVVVNEIPADASNFILEFKITSSSATNAYLIVYNSKSQKDEWLSVWKGLKPMPSEAGYIRSSAEKLPSPELPAKFSNNMLSQPLFSGSAAHSMADLGKDNQNKDIDRPISLQIPSFNPQTPSAPKKLARELSNNLKATRSRRSMVSLGDSGPPSRPRSYSLNEPARTPSTPGSFENRLPVMLSKAQSLADMDQADSHIDDRDLVDREDPLPDQGQDFDAVSIRSSIYPGSEAQSMAPSRAMSVMSIAEPDYVDANITFYTKEIKSLKQDLIEKQQELVHQQQVNTQLTNDLEETQKVYSQAQVSLVETQKTKDLVLRESEGYKSELEDFAQSKELMEQAIASLNAENHKLKDSYLMKEAEIEKLRRDMSSQRADVSNAAESLRKSAEESRNECENLRRTLKEKEISYTMIAQQLEKERQDVHETLVALQDKLAASEQEKASLRDEIGAETRRSGHFQGKITKLDSELTEARIKSEKSQKDLLLALEKEKSYIQEIQTEKRKSETLQKKLVPLEGEISKLKTAKSRLETENADMQAQSEKLTLELNDAKVFTQRLIAENEIIKVKFEEAARIAAEAEDSHKEVEILKETIRELGGSRSPSAKSLAGDRSFETLSQSVSAEKLEMRKSAPVLPSHSYNYKVPQAALLIRLEELEKENAELKEQDPVNAKSIIRKDSMAVEIHRLNKKVNTLSKELDNERASLNDLRGSQPSLSGKLAGAMFSSPTAESWKDSSIDRGLGTSVEAQTDDNLLETHQVMITLLKTVDDIKSSCASQLEEMNRVNKKSKDKCEKEHALVLQLQKENENITRQIQSLQIAGDPETDAFRSQVDSLNAELSTLRKDLLNAKVAAEQAKAYEKSNTDLKPQIQGLNGKLTDLQNELHEAKKAAETECQEKLSMEWKLKQLELREKELGTQVEFESSTRRTSLTKSETAMKELTRELTSLQAKLHSASEEKRLLLEQREAVQARLESTQNVKDREGKLFTEKVSQLEHDKADLVSQVTSLSAEHDSDSLHIHHLQTELSSLQQHLAGNEKVQLDLRKQVSKFQQQCVEWETKAAHISQNYQQEITRLSDEIQVLNEKCEKLQQESFEKTIRNSKVAEHQSQVEARIERPASKDMERVSMLKYQLSNVGAELQQARATIIELEDTNRELLVDKQASSAATKDLSKQLETINRQRKDLQVEVDRLKPMLSTETSRADTNEFLVESLQQEIIKLKTTLESLKEVERKYSKLKEKMNTAVATHECETQALKDKLMALEVEIESNSSVTADSEKLKGLFRDVGSVLQTQISTGGDVVSSIKRVVTEYEALKVDTKQILEKLMTLESQQGPSVSTQVQQLERKLVEKTTAYEKLRRETSSLIIDHEQVLNRLQSLEEQRTKADESMEAPSQVEIVSKRHGESPSMNELVSLRNQLSKLESQLHVEIRKRETIESQLLWDLEEKNQRLRDLVNRSKFVPIADFETCCQQIDTLNTKILALKHEISETALQLEECKQQLRVESSQNAHNQAQLTAKEKEMIKLISVIDDYKRHLTKMEEFYGETIQNREKDIGVLKQEIHTLLAHSHKTQSNSRRQSFGQLKK